MNIAERSIEKSTVTWVLTILLAVVGYTSFNALSRLEDPEFTIDRSAMFKSRSPLTGVLPCLL